MFENLKQNKLHERNDYCILQHLRTKRDAVKPCPVLMAAVNQSVNCTGAQESNVFSTTSKKSIRASEA